MIPSVQLLTNNGVISSIHRDVLDKFVLPITPNSSPINDQSIQQESHEEQYEEQFDHDQSSIHHEEVFRVCYSDGKSIYSENCLESNAIELHSADDSVACSNGENGEINYAIIGNGLIVNTIDSAEVDIGDECEDDGGRNSPKKHEVLMQIVDIPMIYCNSLTPTTTSNSMITSISNSINEAASLQEAIAHVNSDSGKLQQRSANHKHRMNDQNASNCNDNHGSADDDQNTISYLEESNEENTQSYSDCKRPKLSNDICKDDDCSVQGNNDDTDVDENGDESSSERDLTNLSWLMCLKNIPNLSADTSTTTATTTNRKHSNGNMQATPTNAISNCIIDDIDDDDGCVEPMITDKDLSEERFKKFTIQVKQSQINYIERESIFKSDPFEKPPFNYAQIIAMAMMDQGRMTLKDICKWIQEHFAYFRYNKNWNNSIRHNLSLHFCFTKIARDKTEKGKGGYWELSMNTAKSEKKRIRNRRKQRDESGRFSHSHRNTLSTRKNCQKQTNTNAKTGQSQTKSKLSPSLGIIHNDSCNVSTSSEASSSMSANGMNDDSINVWADLNDDRSASLLCANQQQIQKKHMKQQIINDIIVNDLVVVNGGDVTTLSQSDNALIRCNYEKNSSQIVDSYFIEQPQLSTQQQIQHKRLSTTDSIGSSAAAVILNDSSNEIFIKGDTIQTNLINGSPVTTSAVAALSPTIVTTSNVIVEPLPYCLSHMDTVIDIEHEFSNLVNMPDPELAEDSFFDYSNW